MTSGLWDISAVAAKLLIYAGLLGAIGAVFFDAVFDRKHPRLLFGCLLSGLFGTILSFSLNAMALTGSVAGLTDPFILSLLWGGPVGWALALRLVGCFFLLTSLTRFRGQKISVGLGCICILASFFQVGHVSTLEYVTAKPALFLHLLGVTFWLGALWPLYHMACTCPPIQTSVIAHRFGQIAMIVVPLLLFMGGFLAWLILGSFDALFNSAYGRALALKIAFVVALLILATLNKLRFVPKLRAGDQNAATQLAMTIRWEALAFAAIFLLTAIFTSILSLPH
ncbi:copper resistance D family protein [Cochlodiniinecator piscidefendens]|uniref:copper resistance D family protein n=1 Tax=Cochlodiniinecator piscidefendens TaxID=2715756 RepID=UPI001408739B|nr:CopD family protein [Cochlodiniinecator piscidefendens]